MNRIKDLRKKHKLSQGELADMVNCATATISKYELEHRKIPQGMIVKLCEIFGCSSDYLLGFEENEKPAVTGELTPPSEEFIRLQQANELFLQLDEAGRAQALAYLKFLASQREN